MRPFLILPGWAIRSGRPEGRIGAPSYETATAGARGPGPNPASLTTVAVVLGGTAAIRAESKTPTFTVFAAFVSWLEDAEPMVENKETMQKTRIGCFMVETPEMDFPPQNMGF